MKKIKKGDYVARKSYGKDIIFYVKRIIKTSKEEIAILCGLLERIEADSKIEDLEKVDKNIVRNKIKNEEEKCSILIKQKDIKYKNRMKDNDRTRLTQRIVTGKILHLDGDRRYSQKSYNYYKKLGLNAIVKNIPEYRQSKEVYQLLKIYNPDILVITGHDGMIKKGRNYNDLYNYRNSRHFISTVKEARRYDRDYKRNTVIFARGLSKLFRSYYNGRSKFRFISI